jgi:hypothetical protein
MRLSRALKSGLFTEWAITERRHSAAWRVWQEAQSWAVVSAEASGTSGETFARRGGSGAGFSVATAATAIAAPRPRGQRLFTRSIADRGLLSARPDRSAVRPFDRTGTDAAASSGGSTRARGFSAAGSGAVLFDLSSPAARLLGGS